MPILYSLIPRERLQKEILGPFVGEAVNHVTERAVLKILHKKAVTVESIEDFLRICGEMKHSEK